MLSGHDILTLLSIRRIGRRTVQRALDIAQDVDGPSDLISLLEEVRSQGGRVALPDPAAVAEAREASDRLVTHTKELGIEILTPHSDAFPERLRHIPDAPVILFARGRTDSLRHQESVAIVGTRHPTSYGREVATRLGRRAAECGFVVVSGLAEGVDAAAHRGCLSVGGATVAVLAHGLDRVYPTHHERLAQEIVDSDGCLVSEYPPTNRAHRSQFVERNRLQSGIGQCVIVVETDVKGGTMHTARFANEQRRITACVRHPDGSSDIPQAQGNRQLLTESQAVPLASAEDMDNLLDRLSREKLEGIGNQLELFR